MFCTSVGTALDAANVRRSFRRVAAAAGLDAQAWTPRELRHSFVSLLSSTGMSIEDISHLVGHASSRVTELVYRHELRPVIPTGATTTDSLSDPLRCDAVVPRPSLGPSVGALVTPVARLTAYGFAFVLVRWGVVAVGLRGLEPLASSLSGKRSNRLSYRPVADPAAPPSRRRERRGYLTLRPTNKTVCRPLGRADGIPDLRGEVSRR